MFSSKKKEIERLRRENAIWQAQDRENIKRTKELRGRIIQLTADRDKLEQDLEALQDKFTEEHEQTSGLMKANGELKRKLDAAQHTIETQQNEMHTMYEKMSAAAAQQNACPADCVRHQKPGPGGSVCRNCTRNPHAVDKYTNGKNGQEATQ